MPGKSGGSKPPAGPEGADAVDEFLRKSDHPLKPEMEAIRKVILGAAPGIREGIKWNAPSFHFKEYFATFNLGSRDFIRVVFHMGARARDNSTGKARIDDPGGLLEWHAGDRCSARFRGMKEVKSNAAALREIVRQWIRRM